MLIALRVVVCTAACGGAKHSGRSLLGRLRNRQKQADQMRVITCVWDLSKKDAEHLVYF